MPHAEATPDFLQQQIENVLAAEGLGIETCRFSCEPIVSV
jgi:hypothetical protein